jgi:hypothetical protein
MAATAAALLPLVAGALTTLTVDAADAMVAEPTSTRVLAASPAVTTGTTAESGVPGAPISFGEGDLVPTAATRLVAGTRGSTSWRTVALPSTVAPGFAAGAVMVSVAATGASRDGQVQLRPAGSASGGNTAAWYRKGSAGGLGSSVVPVSVKGFQWRVTGGAPRVTVRVHGWIPRTSALVPTDHGSAVSTKAGSAAKLVRLPGVTGSGTTVMVQVTTNRTGSGTSRLAIWSPSASPSATTAVRAGHRSYLSVLRPDGAGRVMVRASGGTVPVTLTVVGSASDPVTLSGPAAERSLGSVKPGAVRTVRLTGAAGVPSTDVRTVLVKVQAPSGATVKLWRGSTSATPDHTFTSTGGAVTVPIQPATNGTVKVRTTGRSATALSAAGWATGGGVDQDVTMTPFTDTRLYGPADVVEQGTGTVTIRSTSAAPVVGGHVMVRPRSDAGSYLGLVTAIEGVPGGRKLTLENADLPDAFADYRVRYGDPTSVPALRGTARREVSGRETTRVDRGGAPEGFAIGTDPRENGWSCQGAGSATPVTTTLDANIDPNIDLNLADRSVDLSVKQSLTASVTLAPRDGTYSCSWEARFLGDEGIPVGTTGLSFNVGVTGRVTADLDTAVTLTGSERAFAGHFHSPGNDTHNEAVDVDFGVGADVAGSLSVDVAVFVALDMGVPGVPKTSPVEAELEGSIEFGLSFQVGTPPTLKGPHCIDVTVGPYVEVGGKLLLEFFGKDAVEVEFADFRKDFDTETIYAGPCLGYTGTISHDERSHQDIGDCGGVPCQTYDSHTKLTVSPLPEPAVFIGNGVVFQSYSWAGSRNAHDASINSCSHTSTSQGSGIRTYKDGSGANGPYLYLDHPSREVNFQEASYPGVLEKVETACPGQPPTTEFYETGYGMSAYIQLDASQPMLDVQPTPTITWSGILYDDPASGRTRTFDVSLTLQEFPRTKAGPPGG